MAYATHTPLVCLLALLAASCGGHALLRFEPAGPDRFPLRQDACEIQVFRDAVPDRPYVKVGVINYHHERHRTSAATLTLDAALPQITARACRAGADAVILHVTQNRRLEWALFHVTATAVRFDVPPATSK